MFFLHQSWPTRNRSLCEFESGSWRSACPVVVHRIRHADSFIWRATGMTRIFQTQLFDGGWRHSFVSQNYWINDSIDYHGFNWFRPTRDVSLTSLPTPLENSTPKPSTLRLSIGSRLARRASSVCAIIESSHASRTTRCFWQLIGLPRETRPDKQQRYVTSYFLPKYNQWEWRY